MLIPGIIQILFGYRHYAHRKCPTSLGNGARSRRNYQGARGKIKKEQGAKRNDKGAVKIGEKERTSQNGREQGERGKMSKLAGSIDPPNRASIYPTTQ